MFMPTPNPISAIKSKKQQASSKLPRVPKKTTIKYMCMVAHKLGWGPPIRIILDICDKF